METAAVGAASASPGRGSDSDGPDVEIGFVEPLSESPPACALDEADWREWDGGVVGGRPRWLDATAPPSAAALSCAACATPLPLLVQLYAPLDADAVGHAGAFHRMLYVFACASAACVNRAPDAGGAPPPGVRVLRCQLPRDSFAVPAEAGVPRPRPAPTCAVCGLAGTQRCARCRAVHYCSRPHQAAHWAGGHAAACAAAAAAGAGAAAVAAAAAPMPVASAVARGLLFPTWELVVEHEPARAERSRRAAAGLTGAVADAAARAAAGGVVSAGDVDGNADGESRRRDGGGGEGGEEGDLSIAGLTQRALAAATGAALFADAHACYFSQRTAAEPAQVVRYCRWPPDVDAEAEVQDGEGAKPRAAAAAATPAPPRSGDGGEDDDNEEEVDDEAEDLDGGDAEPLGAPLWTTAAHRPPRGAVPPCARCGAPRRFEFQVLPQLLVHVATDDTPAAAAAVAAAARGSSGDERARPPARPARPSDLDFGTIAVYTCTRSCSGGAEDAAGVLPPGCALEFAWVQPAESAAHADVARAWAAAAAAAAGSGSAVGGGAGGDATVLAEDRRY